MTGEELLYAARLEAERRGLRLLIHTTQPELIESKRWGGWRRPKRVYVVSVINPRNGTRGSVCGTSVPVALQELISGLRLYNPHAFRAA